MSNARFVVPKPEAIQQLFSGLLGRTVAVRRAAAPQALTAGTGVVAEYVDDAGAVVAVVVCDLALACASGAALSLMPPNVAAEAIAAGKPSGAVLDNVREVLNVLASVLHSDSSPHLRLGTVTVLPSKPSSEAAAVIARAPGRLDVSVAIASHKPGWLAARVT